MITYYTEHRKQLFSKHVGSRDQIVLARLVDNGRPQFTTRDVVRLVQNQAWVASSLDGTVIVRDVLLNLERTGQIRQCPKQGKSEIWEIHSQLIA